MRLAKAWGELDRTAWKSEASIIDSALTIDPRTRALPGVCASHLRGATSRTKRRQWLIVAVALDGAHETRRG